MDGRYDRKTVPSTGSRESPICIDEIPNQEAQVSVEGIITDG